MRKLLTLALLLYDIVDANRLKYDYDDTESTKRHSMIDDRRNWRKKALLKSYDQESKNWDERRRYEQDNLRNYDDIKNNILRRGDYDVSDPVYTGTKNNEDSDKLRYGSGEIRHAMEKETESKAPFIMNCERPHERYEACFAGCSAITCDNPRERLRPCYPFCEPGCICVQPYVRDDRTHKCVLPDSCTKGLKGIPDLSEDG